MSLAEKAKTAGEIYNTLTVRLGLKQKELVRRANEKWVLLADAEAEIAKLEGAVAETKILLHPQLRNSRFDYNARYMRFDEAQNVSEFKEVTLALENAENFKPYVVGDFTFYRRGTGGLWLYVVRSCDFKMPRERKNHKVKSLGAVLNQKEAEK